MFGLVVIFQIYTGCLAMLSCWVGQQFANIYRHIQRLIPTEIDDNAIDLKMNTILPAFDFPSDNRAPQRYSKSSGHIVFDIKMYFTRKAR